MDGIISCSFFIHTCVKFCALNICVICFFVIKLELIIWLGIIIFTISKKGVLWKFWLDPRFPWNSKLKWILKWLPLDRGCFKFYFFTKGESSLIIRCHTSLLTRNFVIFISSRVCIIMYFIPVKCFVFRYYWSIIPRKRGGMETLARSSVSLSPQVKVRFKSTVSR